MKKVFNPIFLFMMLIASSVHVEASVNALDRMNPVKLYGDSVVVFGNRRFVLGPSAIYLDGLLNDASSPYVYNDVVKALEAIGRLGSEKVTLLVAPSVYWIDNPDDPGMRRNPESSSGVPYGIEVECDSLRIVGLAAVPENVVFAVNRGQTQGALGNYTMMHFRGSSLYMENMTFGNYCNVDLDYPLNPAFDRRKRHEAVVQSQIGICDGTDRLFARNCRFISRLNMCPFVGARRSLFKDCYMECGDDALAGSAVYLDCKFTWFSTKPFYNTAKTGAVFLNCDIDIKGDGVQYITKVPGVVTMIDTRFHRKGDDQRRMALRWTRDVSSVICYQSNVSVDGKSYFIDAERPQLSVDLTDKPLLYAYKIEHDGMVIYNTPNLLAGDDGWDPLGLRCEIEKLQEQVGRRLLGIPVVAGFGVDDVNMQSSGDKFRLSPGYRLWGDYPYVGVPFEGEMRWSFPDCLKLYAADAGDVVCVSGNVIPKSVSGVVSMSHDFGWQGNVAVNVAPYLKAAPDFIDIPELTYDKKSKGIRLRYSLASINCDDSFVAWYRKGVDGDTVRVRHGKVPGQLVYRPGYADMGNYIIAVVTPKGDDTKPGQPVLVEFGERISSDHVHGVDKEQKTLMTDFSDMPVHYQPRIEKGWWTFDAYKPLDTHMHDWAADERRGWYYGHGVDGARGIGLVQMTKGARMFYVPYRDRCRNMSVAFVVEPCKPAGQGFGSATGQYMDIYIKFDPVTLSGYALRIERTADYDRAVVFSLVSYDKGVVTPISEPVVSSCYRSPCEIALSIRDGVFTASASTTVPVQSREGIEETVFLSASVVPNNHSALGIQHTGSVGASATLISKLEASWE